MQRTNNESVSEGTATSPRLKFSLLVLALLSGLSASAQTSTLTTNFTDGRVIPDTSASGLASTRMVSTRITQMTDLNVTLKVNGSFNGDLYAYLLHNSGRTVLLNRVGKRAGNNLGYGDDGLDVTFDDAATGGDAHVYRYTINGGNHNPALPANTPLTGTWAPDGRTNSPLTVLDTDARAALLNSFNGLNPNGEWVLFVADLESGDIHTLDSWGLQITGYTAPLITGNPASLIKECALEIATFSVTAEGSAPLSYQWRHGGSSIPDATNSTLTIPNVTSADGGNYDVIVSNPYGSVTSSVATLTVQDTTAPVAPTLAIVTGECSATVTAPTATDNCAGNIVGTTTDPLTYNTQGTFIVHWSFNDGNGNVSTANQTVIVDDVTAPTVTCPANISVFTTNASGTAVSFTLPSGADNCGVASVVASPASDSNFPIGTTPVVVTVTDIGGNTGQCSFNVTVVLNTTPVAANDNMGAVQNQSRSVKIEKCISNDWDLDDDVLTIIAVSNGAHGTATFNSTHITYTPATNYTGSDAFTYTISDGRGGVATATIMVEVYSAEAATPNMLPIVMNGSVPTVRFAGIPGFTYTLERTPTMSPAAWQPIGGTITVPANGIAEYPDTTAPVGSAFYRTVSEALP